MSAEITKEELETKPQGFKAICVFWLGLALLYIVFVIVYTAGDMIDMAQTAMLFLGCLLCLYIALFINCVNLGLRIQYLEQELEKVRR